MRFDNIQMNGIFANKTPFSIAAASTTDLATADSNLVTVTGNTGITALGTVPVGTVFEITFTGTPTITYNASSLILPTLADIVVAAGDVAQFVSLGSGNWRCIGYLRADGSALAGGAAYTTLSKATWTALVAASGLVPGTFYRVTAAYTSALFAGDFDMEVLATSVNTVAENCVIYGSGAIPLDGFTSTDGAFTYVRIAATSYNAQATVNGSLITANNASPINFQPGSWVYINDSSSYKLKANVGSDGVISVENVLCIDPASPQYNLIGIYDVATDVLIPQTIRTQRIALSTSDIQAGTAIPLSQFPAISGSYWNATNVIVALTAGATPYTTTLLIQADGATNDQWRYALTSATSEKVLITDRRTNGDCFPDNAGMRIQFSGSDFLGDGRAIVWVTAELLTT